MTVTSFFSELTKPLHESVYSELEKQKKELVICENKLIDRNSELIEAQFTIDKLKEELAKSLVPKQLFVDDFLSKKYKVIGNIAYKGKRTITINQDAIKKVKTGSFSVYLNEMITPDSFEVIRYLTKFTSSNRFEFFRNVAADFTKKNTWVSEPDLYKTGDFYLEPREALTFMLDSLDCDDCANTIVSMDHEYAYVAMGKYIPDPNKPSEFFWHAYPVFIDEKGDEYIVETTKQFGELVRASDPHYQAHLIYTKNKTYEVINGTQFGYLDYL